MFDLLIVQPIFNLLVLIYALLPGHNFGIAIILFTVVIRLLMWPLVKKQLHQVKLMRKAQPAIKQIKKAAGGDKRKESVMLLELYKERGISPFGQIGIILLQIPILLGLYLGLQKVLNNPDELFTFSYSFLQDLSWLQQLHQNVSLFDETLVGVVDLSRAALSSGSIYWPALAIVAGSAVVQYYQSKQLTPDDKDARNLRAILRDAKSGKQADQSEVSTAMARNTRYILPVLIFVFTIHLPSALALYWLVSGLVAFIQQSIVLREDVEEMEKIADEKTPAKKPAKGKGGQAPSAADKAKNAIEAEVVAAPADKAKPKPKSKTAARKKRRKK